MADDKQKVLVLGGGFGGIKTALELSKSNKFEVTLMSDRDSFRYYPTLYRTATGRSQMASSIPLAEILKGKNVHIIIDSATSLDRDKKAISGASGKSYSYDVLVLALGVVTNFFGIKGLEKYAYGIKTNEEAQRLRNHLHKQLEDDKKPDLNYIVIGGGPTGVELAGALPKYLQFVMKNHGIDNRNIHIDLVDRAPRLVARMPEGYSRAVEKRMRKLGIRLIMNETVEAETADELKVSKQSIASHTVIWTAGVTNHPFLKTVGLELNEQGKAVVDQYLGAGPGIYVIGDNAATTYSGMAQTALYDAVFISDHIKRQAAGRKLRAYTPKKPIYIIPVGPNWAAVLWGKVSIYAWLGWALRSAADLVGYHDYEPWWTAGKHWMAASQSEETCPICRQA